MGQSRPATDRLVLHHFRLSVRESTVATNSTLLVWFVLARMSLFRHLQVGLAEGEGKGRKGTGEVEGVNRTRGLLESSSHSEHSAYKLQKFCLFQENPSWIRSFLYERHQSWHLSSLLSLKVDSLTEVPLF